MAKLKCTKEVVFRTDYHAVEELIQEVYGCYYEIMPMEEVGSSQYAATYEKTTKKGVLKEYELADIESLKSGDPSQFILSSIFKDLVNNGHIEEGKYVIDVSW